MLARHRPYKCTRHPTSRMYTKCTELFNIRLGSLEHRRRIFCSKFWTSDLGDFALVRFKEYLCPFSHLYLWDDNVFTTLALAWAGRLDCTDKMEAKKTKGVVSCQKLPKERNTNEHFNGTAVYGGSGGWFDEYKELSMSHKFLLHIASLLSFIYFLLKVLINQKSMSWTAGAQNLQLRSPLTMTKRTLNKYSQLIFVNM